ncbi:MAG: hypothetical protein SV201_00255 [Pseudomonadota bacterium]|nr:hypothetical protein [Pseudomonadota bacterium]
MDIEAILKQMVAAANDAVEGDVGEITDYAKQIVEQQKQSLEELAKARISGEIDDDVFEQEVEREKQVVKAQLLAVQIMTEAAAQKAVNAAIDTFKNAVKTII